MESTKPGAMPRVRTCTINIQGGLRPSHQAASKDKLGHILDLLDEKKENFDFIALQDLTLTSSTPPPEVVNRLKPHHIFVTGHRDNTPQHTVAVVVNARWHVLQVHRPSGTHRALGVTARHENGAEITFFSAYLPTNLDTARTSSTVPGRPAYNRMEEAKTILGTCLETGRNKLCIIGADANTTAGKRDREGNRGWQSPALHDSVLAENSGYTDIFRALNPDADGFTHDSARIDYIFSSIQLDQEATCWTVHDLPSDHARVCASLALPNLRGNPATTWPRNKRPRSHNLSRASEAQLERFTINSNESAASFITQATATHGSFEDVTELELRELQRELALRISKVADHTLPRAPSRKGERPCIARVRDRMRTVRRCIKRCRQDIRRCKGNQDRFRSALQQRASRRSRAGISRLIDIPPTRGEDALRLWTEWLPSAEAKLSQLKDELNARHTTDPDGIRASSADGRWRKAHTTGKGKSRWLDDFIKRTGSSTLCSATDPASGRVMTNPDEYMPAVREGVAAPFSIRVEAPVTTPHDTTDVSDHEKPCTGACLPPPILRKDNGKALADPRPCRDVRCTGVKPEWWDEAYKPICPRDRFADVVSAVAPTDIAQAIARSPGGKSPKDQLSIDMLKVITNVAKLAACAPHLVRHEDETRLVSADSHLPPDMELDNAHTPVAEAVALVTNLAFKLGVQTDFVTEGSITMIPKDPTALAPPVTDLRPITLLSELGKIANKIIAERITRTLTRHPDLLARAQRAFLPNGDTDQCLSALLDVLEDARLRRDRDGKETSELHIIAYDLAKAYDSAQEFSVRATLERYAFPRAAIEYLCSPFRTATSRVSTAHGLTQPFRVLSGVRQGDPVAPVLFILLLDVLHRGFEDCPLGNVEGMGVAIDNGDPHRASPRVFSAGYADDTTCMATTYEAAARMNEWCRSFFGAHAFRFNAKKSVYATNAPLNTLPDSGWGLPTVNGRFALPPHGPQDAFRYLGCMVRLDMQWTEELARLNRLVRFAHSRIMAAALPLAPAVDVINTYLVPQLERSLICMPPSEQLSIQLKEWTSQLRRAALAHTASGSHSPAFAVPSEAIHTVTGLVDLEMHASYTRVAALHTRLCMREHVLIPTGAARLRCDLARLADTDLDDEEFNAALETLNLPGANSACPDQGPLGRAALTLREARGEFEATFRFHVPPKPNTPLPTVDYHSLDPLSHMRQDPWTWGPSFLPIPPLMRPGDENRKALREQGTLLFFTDGSTPVGDKAGNPSGCAVIAAASEGSPEIKLTLRCPLKGSGNNYFAELMAIFLIVVNVPECCDIRIYTDAEAAIKAIARDDSAERKRIRSAARALLTTLKRYLRFRSGKCDLVHVASHSGEDTWEAFMNEKADEAANEARRSVPLGFQGKDFLEGEELFYVRHHGVLITGDVRKAGKRWARDETYMRWANPARGFYSQVPRAGSAHDVHELCRVARRQGDSQQLLFLALSMCQALPTGRFLSRRAGKGADHVANPEYACQACPAPGHVTTAHALVHCNVAARSLPLAMYTVESAVAHAASDAGILIPAPRNRRSPRATAQAAARNLNLGEGPRGRNIELGPSAAALARSVLPVLICEAGHAPRDRSRPLKCPASASDVVCSALNEAADLMGGWSSVRNLVDGPIGQALVQLPPALGLDTQLLTTSVTRAAGISHWSSPCAHDTALGAHRTFKMAWGGTFALLAPAWTMPACLHSQGLWKRCLSRARRALRCPRPTRFVIVLPEDLLCDPSIKRLGAKLLASLSHPIPVRVVLLDNARARSVSPLCPRVAASRWPATLPMKGCWWAPRAPGPDPRRLRPSGSLPLLIDAPHVPTPWPGAHTLTSGPEPYTDAEAILAYIGVLPKKFLELLVIRVAGECEVKRKRFRRALSKRVPTMRAQLLALALARYRRDRAIRKASWEAGSGAWLATDSSDVLALRVHQRKWAKDTGAYERQRANKASRRVARARISFVAERLGMTATQYRAHIGAPGKNPPIPPDHQHLLQGFDPLVVRFPPRRGGLRSPPPDAARVCYIDNYVMAADEPDFWMQDKRGRTSARDRLLERFAALF